MNRAPKRHVALRIGEPALERIDQLAGTYGLTRTEYLIRSALGELEDPIEIDARFKVLNDRVQRLEALAFGT